MSNIKKINTPLTDDIVNSLNAGDEVFITGTILTGRDAAHKRLCELLEKGENLPINLNGEIIYFVGPTPAKPGKVIGSAGPTTSSRMDAYSPILMDKVGLKGMIGKGPRGEDVISSMKKNNAVYFVAIGGAAALISESIKSAEIILYEDLGPEAIHKLKVVNFPVIVAVDSKGNNFFEEGPKQFSK